MQLRYSFLYPDTGQQRSLGKAGELSTRLITEAERTAERCRLGEVSAVVLQQSLRDSVTVVKDAAGRYFASFVIDTDPAADRARMPETDRTVGIDLGLTHFAVLSDGTKIDSPRFLRRAEKKLKKARRELSRKQKGSKNRARACLKAARAHAKVADARREFHHQLSTRLIRDQAVAVEDLAVGGLARTRLARCVHDAGWSQFVGMLEYRAKRYGRTFVKIDRFEPTSQVCSTCGHRDGPEALHVKVWTCAACGTVHDRDINAAINVRTAAGPVAPHRGGVRLPARGRGGAGGVVHPQGDRATGGKPGAHPGGLPIGGALPTKGWAAVRARVEAAVTSNSNHV
ncbi:RNA-guided endonuclease InsQ/TnpB family protein [Streptomyces sp. NPDC020490]|uniref:RNA-guided endonuclease InsQ/TnpB family protein n=1 Tax=Streptomyces sp. NPDC020490 TaxID=3365078 RepID=UPI00378C8688